MAYSAVYQGFCNDKYSFFSNVSKNLHTEPHSQKDYIFLANNHVLIEQEFTQLFSILQKNKSTQPEFWRYCYYCCEMLLQYYQAYDDTAKISAYEELMAKIKPYCDGTLPLNPPTNRSFVRHLGHKLSKDIVDLVAMPKHVYRIRDMVGFLNICRLYWAFCRLTVTSALKVARDAQWIERLNQLLSKQINVDKIIKILEAPNAVLKVCSIGFFVARFILNAAMVLKHTFLPSDAEKRMSKRQRFQQEIAKRHATFLNDIVWGTVNSLVNYVPMFYPVASWITAGFLTFDVALLLWRRHLEEKQYLLKKSQYEADLKYYSNQKKDAGDSLLIEQQIAIIREQKKELDITWQAQNAFWLFNAAAALIFFAGFTASLLLTPGILIVASYAVCMVAASMYLTADSFKSYQEKDLRLTQADADKQDRVMPLAEYQLARNQFFLAITKQIVVPGVLIASWFICWQAALALTALYVSWELYCAWSQHQPTDKSSKEINPDEQASMAQGTGR